LVNKVHIVLGRARREEVGDEMQLPGVGEQDVQLAQDTAREGRFRGVNAEGACESQTDSLCWTYQGLTVASLLKAMSWIMVGSIDVD
jgi:hypothetical protein